MKRSIWPAATDGSRMALRILAARHPTRHAGSGTWLRRHATKSADCARGVSRETSDVISNFDDMKGTRYMRVVVQRGRVERQRASALITSANDALVGNLQPEYWRDVVGPAELVRCVDRSI